MCIIILKPAKIVLSRERLHTCWKGNPHGAGFMYSEDGEVKVVKGLMTFEEFWKAIEEVGPARKLVMHFRIKTHGAVSQELTHPFWIRESKLAMVHNGIISACANAASEKESDTAVFARRFGTSYANPLLAVKNPFHRDMLEAYIGYSKLVFMDETGETYILNEKMGTWDAGVWYSNTHYKESPYSFGHLASKYLGYGASEHAEWASEYEPTWKEPPVSTPFQGVSGNTPTQPPPSSSTVEVEGNSGRRSKKDRKRARKERTVTPGAELAHRPTQTPLLGLGPRRSTGPSDE